MKRKISFFFAALLLGTSASFASSPQYIALADSADNYIKRERWEDAERVIISALRLEPANFSNSLLFSNLGVVRTEMGKYDEALQAFSLGMSIAPGSSTLRNNRARTLLHIGRADEAFDDLNESLKIDSIQEWPLLMRGMILLSKGAPKDAKLDFNRVLKWNPSNASALAGMGRACEKEGNFTDAIKYYDESIEMEDDEETRSARILLKINLEKYSDASADIAASIAKYPENPYFYLWRGYLHRRNYRYPEAEADKKIALSKGADPQMVEELIPKTRR